MSSSAGLQQAFRPFGSVKVEWPGKEGKQNRHPPKGNYLRMLLEIFQCGDKSICGVYELQHGQKFNIYGQQI